MPLDKKVLNDYIDICENVKDIEKDIRRIKKQRKTIIQTNVTGSNSEFPYEQKHFKIQGIQFSYTDDQRLRMTEKILEERKKNAEMQKIKVEEWLNLIPSRMQRIIRYKIFEGLNWEQVARKIGRKATGEGIRKEFERFMGEK